MTTPHHEPNNSSDTVVWLFQARPEYYDLAAKLENIHVGAESGWTVSRYRDEIHPGQTVVLWQAGTKAGIYAIGELTSEPYRRNDDISEDELEQSPYLKNRWAVDFRYTQILEEPVSRDYLKQHPILRSMQVMIFPQATNFSVAPDEWSIVKELVEKPPSSRSCWKISPGEKAYAWNDFRQRNVIAIGWWGYGDLRPSAPSSREEIRGELELQAEDGGDPGYVSRQFWHLYGEMKPGDTVFAYGNDKILGWGEILGDYVFEQDDFGFPHRRKVRWYDLDTAPAGQLSPELRNKFWRPRTIIPLTPEECGEIRRLMLRAGSEITNGTPDGGAMEILVREVAARGLRFTLWQIATFYTALQTKGFVILSGISGTGKTKLAQHFAAMLPQPAALPEPALDQLIITVKPYMLKYNRFIIPKHAVKYFEFPPPGETLEIEVRLDDRRQPCRLTHNETGSGTYLSLLLKGPVRERFSEQFSEGDRFVLEPELDDERGLTGFRLVPDLAAPTPGAAPEVPQGHNALFLSVRPDWRDSKNLLGYFNPLTGAYQWTPFLRFLIRAAESYRRQDGLAWFVILDEMNLAHVEYYFADLLSVLESGRNAEGWTNEPLRLVDTEEATEDLPPTEVRLPPNLYVVGTVNADETTRAFSPKVLDRAFSLELSDVDFNDYPNEPDSTPTGLSDNERWDLLRTFTSQGTFVRIDKGTIATHVAAHPELREMLQNLNEQLRRYTLHFGYRVFDEIVTFSATAEKSEAFFQIPGPNPALDTAVLLKVLPKFHGSRSKLEVPLKALLAWCKDPTSPDLKSIEVLAQGSETADTLIEALSGVSYVFPRTAERALRMLRNLYEEGFASFG